ncbi:MAG: sensor histidine kinase [Sphingopyxis sp.]|nr:sensor histidine kinase [Sphingopyxis sp.]
MLPADLPLSPPTRAADPYPRQSDRGATQRHARARIAISASPEDGSIQLHVDDDGVGIADDLQDRLFDRFARGAGSDRDGGSGLGLAIVKGFADAMALTVSAGAAPGGGARFTLALPQRQVTVA